MTRLPQRFRVSLLRWFDREKRTLPWRGERDPYRILLSEIMLQQTRVAVVKERYRAFLRQFPNVTRLARTPVESVLAAWSGLGYYRRARALHAAAKQIHQRRMFPRSAGELVQLPGIGRYTAAAVASIAFDQPVAVVDGNVKRVLQRLAGELLSEEACWEQAQELLEKRRPGDFNQALMELGATVCLPRRPLCQSCPVIRFCASSTKVRVPGARRVIAHWGGKAAKSSGLQTLLPAPRNKASLSYLLARKSDAILLQQRAEEISLMPGMWELPQVVPSITATQKPILRLRHSITTTDYTIFLYTAGNHKNISGSWIQLSKANSLPLTGLARKILHKLELLPATN